jgi:hypothetical protein
MGHIISLESVVATAETEDALLVMIDDYGDEVWIPKSQIHDDSEVYHSGHIGTLVITEWIAMQKGLI